MGFRLFNFNEYGQYIWPAFMFTFLSCLILYVKVRNELKVLEKTYMAELQIENVNNTVISSDKILISKNSI